MQEESKWIFKNKAFLKAINAVGVGIDKAILECPKCGYEVLIEKENMNYCPNCWERIMGIKGDTSDW